MLDTNAIADLFDPDSAVYQRMRQAIDSKDRALEFDSIDLFNIP